MAKSTSQSQAAFSFFDEVEKVDPLPRPRKQTLRPPEQIEMVEEKEDAAEIKNDTEDRKNSEKEETVITAGADGPEENTEAPIIASQEENAIPAAEETTHPQPEEEKIQTPEMAGPTERKNTRGRKSVKEHSAAAGMIEMPDDEALFSKQYYSMREVTTMFRENHSLIRYWESEFDILKPKKNGKGDRFFRPADVKNLYLIYDLLRRRKFTIEGAREYLKNNKKAEERFSAVQSLEKIKAFFLELKASL